MPYARTNIPPHVLVVNEIFHSIQGESTHAGRPCTFIRLTWCNIRCSYCDTAYAFEEGSGMTVDDILGRVRQIGCQLVEVTGGEPLFQPNAGELISRLCDEGFEVLVETGGTLDIGMIDDRAVKIVDFKCPSSGMEQKNLWANAGKLAPKDEVKFVVGDRGDYDWARRKIAEHGLEGRCTVLLSPVFGALDPAELASWILGDRLNVRYQIQLHKIIWSPEARGV